jgi:hypothetical protein
MTISTELTAAAHTCLGLVSPAATTRVLGEVALERATLTRHGDQDAGHWVATITGQVGYLARAVLADRFGPAPQRPHRAALRGHVIRVAVTATAIAAWLDPDTAPDVMRAVLVERAAQDRYWGVQDHDPSVWLAVLVEEIGELADVLHNHPYPHLSWVAGMAAVRAARGEAVQVAAVAVAIAEDLDRRSGVTR